MVFHLRTLVWCKTKSILISPDINLAKKGLKWVKDVGRRTMNQFYFFDNYLMRNWSGEAHKSIMHYIVIFH